MAAFPFGGHPKFSAYLAWAAQEGKCRVQTGYKLTKDGRAVSSTLITAPSGKQLVVVDYEQDERLVLSTIAYFDRRLGLKSPYMLDPSSGAVYMPDDVKDS